MIKTEKAESCTFVVKFTAKKSGDGHMNVVDWQVINDSGNGGGLAVAGEAGQGQREITARVAQAGTACSYPDSLCPASPYEGSELASFILDKELLTAVGNACRWCRTPRDVNDRVLSLLRQSKAWNSRIFLSKPFLASLVPLLTNFKQTPNSSLLYTAIWKQL